MRLSLAIWLLLAGSAFSWPAPKDKPVRIEDALPGMWEMKWGGCHYYAWFDKEWRYHHAWRNPRDPHPEPPDWREGSYFPRGDGSMRVREGSVWYRWHLTRDGDGWSGWCEREDENGSGHLLVELRRVAD